MTRRIGSLKISFGLALAAAALMGTLAYGRKPPPPPPPPVGCPKDIVCLDVWLPVICANGVTYSNQCYADRACAPGPCVPANPAE